MKLLWLHDGAVVPQGTNSSLVIASIEADDAGRYQLWASNSFGTLLTEPALLTLGNRPRITVEPTPRVAVVGTSARFEVTTDGTPPLSYQWFFKGIPLVEATLGTLALSEVSLAHAGDYVVAVSNAFGQVNSRPALLTVNPLPTLSITNTVAATAEAGGAPGWVTISRSYSTASPLTVRYSQAGTARAGADYQPLSGVAVIPAELLSVSIPILAIEDPWVEGPETVDVVLSVGVGYTLSLANKATVTLIDNDLPPSTEGTNVVASFGLTNVWRYQQTADLTTTDWKSRLYNDSAWPSGRGALYVENDIIPVPKLTRLTLGRMTYYFRTGVTLSDTNLLQLSTTLAVDDGAVIYLNGQEAYRLGMRDGDVVYGTSASRSVANAKIEGPFTLPTTNAVVGENVIAVEVHQFDSGSSDIVFAMTLEALAAKAVSPILGDPTISPSGEFQFTLTGQAGQAYSVESSTNLIDWVSVRNVVLPATGALGVNEQTTAEPGSRFYRARPQN